MLHFASFWQKDNFYFFEGMSKKCTKLLEKSGWGRPCERRKNLRSALPLRESHEQVNQRRTLSLGSERPSNQTEDDERKWLWEFRSKWPTKISNKLRRSSEKVWNSRRKSALMELNCTALMAIWSTNSWDPNQTKEPMSTEDLLKKEQDSS